MKHNAAHVAPAVVPGALAKTFRIDLKLKDFSGVSLEVDANGGSADP